MNLFDILLGSIGDEVNRGAINYMASRTQNRPRPFSLWSHEPAPTPPAIGPINDYTSWPALTDKTFSARHLPVASQEYMSGLPAINDVAKLFYRKDQMKTDRSSILFMFFAQWFTDSILRVDPFDKRKNTSNHEIDLCQIYGRDEQTANILRSHTSGKLRHQLIKGEVYPDYLYEQNDSATLKIKEDFEKLPYLNLLDKVFENVDINRRRKAYATGLERGNSSIGYVAISIIFLREHNRICDELKARNPLWDDERLFQTARMINIVLLMKLVVEDYINHIAGRPIFKLDHTFAEDQNWYRSNWIAIEFDLLYRWHSLVPNQISVNGFDLPSTDFRNNNDLLEEFGLGLVVTASSNQRAGRIGLFNAPQFLLAAEASSLTMSRAFRLRSYNDYREQFGLHRLQSFNALTKDDASLAALKCYKSIDDVELLVGMMAEDRSSGALFGDLLNAMVSYDAFTQIFTNPLLSRNIFNAVTFTDYGMDLITSTSSIQDLASRNIKGDVKAKLGVQ